MKSYKHNLFVLSSSEYGLSHHPWMFLLCMYFLSVVIRFSLAFLFRHGPTVQIDESLYINIAKSLAAGEGIAYRSQPVPYMYILYPLLLVPLYLFPLPFDLYRVIQLYNAILISTSVFPIYLFAKDFTTDNKKALLASSITLLMPDMQMAGFLMSESVVWPLSLWLIYFACRLFLSDERKLFSGFMVGLFTALLFWTKPGAIAMGLVLLLSAFFLGDKQSLQKRRPASLLGFAVCFGLVAVFYVLYVFVFGYGMSVLGLYNKQLTAISITWVLAVVEFSLLQLLLFAISCGGVFFVFPFAFFRDYDNNRKHFISAFSLGLVVTAVGTAAFVDMFGWNGSFTNPQLHLRYMAMYLPVPIVFSMGASLSVDEKKKHLLLASLGIMALLAVFPGASIGFVDGVSTYMDSIALSAYLSGFVPPWVGILLTCSMILSLALVCLQILRNQTSSLLKPIFSFLVVFILVNNICGYFACSTHKDPNNYGSDAVQMNTLLESQPRDVLVITQQHYNDTLSYCLESRLRKPYQHVTVDALAVALSETKGVYTPFIPDDQDPNVGNHTTPATDHFLLGITVSDLIELNSSINTLQSDNKWFTLLQVPPGERLADTILSGVDLEFLHEDQQAQLYVYDESRYKNGKLTLHLSASAKKNSAELEITNDGKTQTITLSEKSRICLISLRKGDTILKAHGGDIIISSYWTD